MKIGRGKFMRLIAILLNCIVLFAYGAAFVIFLAGENTIDFFESLMPPENVAIPVLAFLAAATPLCSLIALLKTSGSR